MFYYSRELEQLKQELEKFIDRKFDELFNKINNVEFLRVNDVSEMFNVSRLTVMNWIKSGDVRYFKQGRNYYFRKEYLIELKKHLEKSGGRATKINLIKIEHNKF